MKEQNLRKELYVVETCITAIHHLTYYPKSYADGFDQAMRHLEKRERELCRMLDKITEEKRKP